MSEICPECNGTGFRLTTREDGVVQSTDCPCRLEGQGDRRLRAARIPRRYAHCTFEHFEPQTADLEQACRIARRWVDTWPAVDHGLVFLGAPGTGKTHLAVAIARELVREKGTQVLFYEQRDLLKALQGTFDTEAGLRENEVLGPVVACELLVLDDLGAGRTTPWVRDVMHDVIAQRYNENRPMIITTNHRTGDEPEDPRAATERPLERALSLRDRLGDALMSRLYEMCRFVELRGRGDYRRDVRNAQIRSIATGPDGPASPDPPSGSGRER